MSAKTRIWVFHMKELIYTAVFIVLGIFLLLLMIFMFSGSPEQEVSAEIPSRYTAGVYTASMILGMMILPTIIGTTESAMRAVPAHYYEGSLALGATKERSIFRVIIPAAKSGVIAGIVLGIGRAIGETMAVIMIVGNQARLTGSLLDGIRTLTGNIVIEMGYATGLHREALIATGVVLFVFILIINLSVALLKRGADHE